MHNFSMRYRSLTLVVSSAFRDRNRFRFCSFIAPYAREEICTAQGSAQAEAEHDRQDRTKEQESFLP